jgi:pSer/pThr/pTyr-binding forkhead associated (FHA) protein
MQIVLIVLSEGKVKGKEIPVKSFPFLIGRDPHCQLRPASALVSKRHCSILVRDNKVFLHDFQSTNGTLVNERQIMGDIEIRNGDQVTVGPLSFAVRIETQPPVSRPTPPPAGKTKSDSASDEDAAALLLSGMSEGPAPESAATDSGGVPTGSTIDMEVPPTGEQPEAKSEAKPAAPQKGKEQPDTSKSAAAILDKYRRRPRQ